jgi:DDE superfamily endonuclease
LAPGQKKAVEEGRTLVFADQSGFYLLPGKVRTYAPVGQAPIIRAPLSRDHLSAMGGITSEGKLYLMVQERAYRGGDVVGFLKHLARHVAGKLLVLWDGAPIHRSRVVREYLRNDAAQRIHLEQLPG